MEKNKKKKKETLNALGPKELKETIKISASDMFRSRFS